MTVDEKEIHVGIVVSRPANAKISSETIVTVDSHAETSLTPGGASPPLDAHPPQYSADGHPAESKNNLAAYETDLEACHSTNGTAQLIPEHAQKSCSVWPGRAALKQQKKIEKQQRSCCAPWYRLSSRVRLVLKIVIVLVALCFAVGAGVGISRAVGGGVWNDHTPISGS